MKEAVLAKAAGGHAEDIVNPDVADGLHAAGRGLGQEQAAGWVRKSSMFPATFGLACCAIEMMTTGAG
ncbi:hypothetical protein AB0C60_27825, partial [Streptomyces sp. NPDC048845]